MNADPSDLPPLPPTGAPSDRSPKPLALDDPDDLQNETAASTSTSPRHLEEKHGALLFIDGDTVKLNHPAIAAAFSERRDVAFCPKAGSFFVYQADQGIWAKIGRREVMWLLGEFLKQLADEKKTQSLLVKRTPSLLSGILQLVEGCAPMGQPPPPSSKLLPVQNGVLDLRGPEPVLRPFSKADRFTCKTAFPYIKGAKCDRFLGELVRPALHDPDDVTLLQRDFGRQLIPGNDAQTLSIIVGDGGSGKSVLVSILEYIIGPERVAHLRSDKLNGRFETHGFHRKSTLVGKDVKPDYLSNAGAAIIKSLTGADRIETEQKYGGKFELRGNFFVVITANHRLPIRLEGDASAWRRRLVCYNFTRAAPAKRIPNLAEELVREEGEGILAWLIDGYLAHQVELRDHGGFNLTELQRRRVEDWVIESEGELAFARTEIAKAPGTLSVEEIWQRYTVFARQRGWRIPSKQIFCTRLPEVMMELFNVERDTHIVRNGTAVRGFKGVVFTAD